jgi:hypothetical protein
MSNAPASPVTPPAAPESDSGSNPDRVFLIAYPKIVFMYPTFVVALVAGIVTLTTGQEGKASSVMSDIFLCVFGLNLVVFAFDFPRTTALTMLFIGTSLVLLLLLTFRLSDQILPALRDLVNAFDPKANPTFYFSVAALLGVIFIAVKINVQFDYWEVKGNELLHHHGFMSNLKRFPAQQLRIEKDITDLFEYVLLRSGRLILTPSNEQRSIVLDNVLLINRKEAMITEMLGALKVQIQPPTQHSHTEGEA